MHRTVLFTAKIDVGLICQERARLLDASGTLIWGNREEIERRICIALAWVAVPIGEVSSSRLPAHDVGMLKTLRRVYELLDLLTKYV